MCIGLGIGLGITAATLAVAGGAISTVTALQGIGVQQKQAQYMAEVERENAHLASRAAENIELQSNQERNQLRSRMLATLGGGRAGYAANSVVLGAGSTNDYVADVADAYDLDRRNLDYDIESRKWQKQVEAVNARNQAGFYDAQSGAFGQQKVPSLLGGAFSTAAGGLGGFAGGYSAGNDIAKSGLWDSFSSGVGKLWKKI